MATNYQTGGWYDNPATGTNMRWFPSGWTTGADPGGGSAPSSSGGSTSSSSGTADDYIGIAKNYANSIASTQHAIMAYEVNNPFAFDEAIARTNAGPKLHLGTNN